MLKCENNTPEVEEQILVTTRKAFRYYNIVGKINIFFEHGQWWVKFYEKYEGERIFSVINAEGIGIYNGFDFKTFR